MEIIVAPTAGYCFGVNKAVNNVFTLIEEGTRKIFTLGPVIHNEQVVKNLENRGVKVANCVEEVEDGGHVVIRAHGVTPEVYDKLKARNLKYSDATCPYVQRIHKLVEDRVKEHDNVIIVGDKDHPEVVGINGWCGNKAIIIDSEEDVDNIPDNLENVCVVAQTTLTNEKWEIINKKLKNKFENYKRFDTICSATVKRQTEATELAQKVDMMLVIGGKDSSNTRKLTQISSSYCPRTYQIETSGEIPPVDIKNIKRIGITAGASTPDWIIKEVIEKMNEFNTQENEMSFKEAFESSLVTLQTGQIVKGKIVAFNNAEVFVDLGFKSDGIIPMDQYTDDPDFNPASSIKVGDEIDVFVVRVNDSEGTVMLSKKKVDSMQSWVKVEEALTTQEPLTVKVTDVVSGGLIANYSGVRIFIPASQVSDRFVKDLNEYLKQTLTVRIIEYNRQKKKIVGSSKVILAEQRGRVESDFWATVEIGKKYDGVVKSLTDFGAFVDIGGVDGLVHLSELSWNRIKHPSQVLKVGDQIEVTIQEFDKDKRRISLGYRKSEDNPWLVTAAKYSVGDIVKGKVARIAPFGAFVQLDSGVDGLVHISQISNMRLVKADDVLKVGQEVEAKIIELNIETKKVSLSIKEVNPIDPAPKATEAVEGENNEEIIPSEYKEDMNVTLGDVIEASEKSE